MDTSFYNSLHEHSEKFLEQGLSGIELRRFTNKNILIGKNGSGKTRFLKTLLNICIEGYSNLDAEVVPIFFHESDSKYNSGISKSDIDIYDILFSSETLAFKDFMKIAINDPIALMGNILAAQKIKAPIHSSEWSKRISKINNFLFNTISRELVFDDESTEISITYYEGEIEINRLSVEETLKLLSPGEFRLFFLSFFQLYISNRTETDKKLILLLDEPETHLHPRALIALIKFFVENPNVSSLWIATHAIYLLPLFDFESIISFNNGKILPLSSNTYNYIYNELIGSENLNIFEFLKSLESWQYYNFIAECFVLPSTNDKISTEDPQYKTLKSAIEILRQNNNKQPPLLLDYGAGSLRLLKTLELEFTSNKLIKALDYYAFEPYPDYFYKQMNREKPDVFFVDSNSIKKSFDIVVLLNVLHEITVVDWVKTLSRIESFLNDNGFLLLIEAVSLLNGEQPFGNNGFIVLNDEAVMSLFSLSNDNFKSKSFNISDSNKTNGWILYKKDLKKISSETILLSLETLKNTTKTYLREQFHERVSIANDDNDADIMVSGRKYAFFSQQYINAVFALESLENLSKNQVLAKKNTSTNKKNKMYIGEVKEEKD